MYDVRTIELEKLRIAVLSHVLSVYTYIGCGQRKLEAKKCCIAGIFRGGWMLRLSLVRGKNFRGRESSLDTIILTSQFRG